MVVHSLMLLGETAPPPCLKPSVYFNRGVDASQGNLLKKALSSNERFAGPSSNDTNESSLKSLPYGNKCDLI